jgi:hypothetical protein
VHLAGPGAIVRGPRRRGAEIPEVAVACARHDFWAFCSA